MSPYSSIKISDSPMSSMARLLRMVDGYTSVQFTVLLHPSLYHRVGGIATGCLISCQKQSGSLSHHFRAELPRFHLSSICHHESWRGLLLASLSYTDSWRQVTEGTPQRNYCHHGNCSICRIPFHYISAISPTTQLHLTLIAEPRQELSPEGHKWPKWYTFEHLKDPIFIV